MSSYIDYDAELSPEEIARARKIVAREELKEIVPKYRKALRQIDYTVPSNSPYRKQVAEYEDKIIALVLELIPED
jgi:hypothetical protein